MDDIVLERKGFHRLGNVLIPTDNYGPLVEEKVQKVLLNMYSNGENEPSTSYFVRGWENQFAMKRLHTSLGGQKRDPSIHSGNNRRRRRKSVLAVLSNSQGL